MPEFLITGCRDTQTSADAYIGGTYNGALTYCLVDSLKKAASEPSYRQVHELTASRLKEEGFDQVPQLEGRAKQFDQPFLSPSA